MLRRLQALFSRKSVCLNSPTGKHDLRRAAHNVARYECKYCDFYQKRD